MLLLQDLNIDSYQGDKVVIELLKQMGCQFERTAQGDRMSCQKMHAITIDGSQCPDIIPVMALACAVSEGASRIEKH